MKQKQLRLLLFVNLFSLTGYFTFAPLYALFASSLGLAPKTIGLIWAGYSLLIAVSILVMGRVENRLRKGRVVVIGYSLCAVAALSFLMVHDVQSLIVVLMLNAFAGSITFPAYKTLYAKSETRGKESEEWSWLDAGNMFAAAIGAGIGGLVIGLYGFRGIFITMATIQALAAIVAYRAFYKRT